MSKTITLCDWKVYDTKNSLFNPVKFYFLKDIETNKYWGVINEPNSLDDKAINYQFKRPTSRFCGKSVLNKRHFLYEQLKKNKYKRKFKIVSMSQYIKDVNKQKEKPCPTKKQ